MNKKFFYFYKNIINIYNSNLPTFLNRNLIEISLIHFIKVVIIIIKTISLKSVRAEAHMVGSNDIARL